MDADGSYYCYEISVRHCDVRGIKGHVTSDVMLLMHVARPIGPKSAATGQYSAASVTIVSQVDTRAKGAQWWWPFMPVFRGGGDLVDAKKQVPKKLILACILSTNRYNSCSDTFRFSLRRTFCVSCRRPGTCKTS